MRELSGKEQAIREDDSFLHLHPLRFKRRPSPSVPRSTVLPREWNSKGKEGKRGIESREDEGRGQRDAALRAATKAWNPSGSKANGRRRR